MTNAHAIKLLSPRTRSLLRLHAEAIGVDEAKLANDLFEMMVRDAQNLQRATLVPGQGAAFITPQTSDVEKAA